ncbi:hypothetical protein P7H20_15825 [Paenibacillus larvae]|nr:hypothetical protein [Paenibacillus larvae]MDT2276003.1 hypothetical protein [Paenibacillus larvae]
MVDADLDMRVLPVSAGKAGCHEAVIFGVKADSGTICCRFKQERGEVGFGRPVTSVKGEVS